MFVCIAPLFIGRCGDGSLVDHQIKAVWCSALLQNPAAELRGGYVSIEAVEKQQTAGASDGRRSKPIFQTGVGAWFKRLDEVGKRLCLGIEDAI